jgi:hypothetical protein
MMPMLSPNPATGEALPHPEWPDRQIHAA